MMSVFDMVDFVCDCDVLVFDFNTGEEIFSGWYADIPEEIGELECRSMDAEMKDGKAVICFNVDTSEN